MRRQLVDELPLLMSVYPGFDPTSLDRMTYRELEKVLAYARTVARALQESTDG